MVFFSNVRCSLRVQVFPGSLAVLHSDSFPAFESLLRSHQTDADDQDAMPPGEISSCFTNLPELPGKLPVPAEHCGEWNSDRLLSKASEMPFQSWFKASLYTEVYARPGLGNFALRHERRCMDTRQRRRDCVA